MNPRIAKLKTYKGIPIVFFATIDKKGIPDFKVTDEEKRMRCGKEHLCWICGEPLTMPICFIGGPHSVAQGTFTDGPMHAECAADSMEMCPWLLGRMDYAPPESFKMDRHNRPVRFVTGAARPEMVKSPDRVAIYKCLGFDILILPLQGGRCAWFFKAFTALSVDFRDRIAPTAKTA